MKILVPENMKISLSFFKQKRVWIPTIIVAVIFLLIMASSGNGTEHEMHTIERGNIKQIVSVTGTVKPDPKIDLNFEIPGKISGIYAENGQYVSTGAVLAELENDSQSIAVEDTKAALAAAEANLAQRIAGSTNEEVILAQTQVNQVESELSLSKTDLENKRRLGDENIIRAEISTEDAEAKLNRARIELQNIIRNYDEDIKIAEKASKSSSSTLQKSDIDSQSSTKTTDKSIIDANQNLLTSTNQALIKIKKGLDEADKILGIDSPSANDDFQILLGVFDSNAKPQAEKYYYATLTLYTQSSKLFASDTENINELYIKVKETTKSTATLLEAVSYLLDKTITNTTFPIATLNTHKTNITTSKTDINTSETSLNASYQTLTSAYLKTETTDESAKASFEIAQKNLEKAEQDLSKIKIQAETSIANMKESAKEYEIALKQSKQNLELVKVESDNIIRSAESTVSLKKSLLENSKANLRLVKAPPRDVDIQSLEAQVLQAKARLKSVEYDLQKTQLLSPFAGIITKVNIEKGETYSLGSPDNALEITSKILKVEAEVSETDIAKISVGDRVTMTLDAFNRDQKFFGTIKQIEPAETIISGVVYYKVDTLFELPYEGIKPGMTANLDILTEEKDNVLIVPLRAVIFEKDNEYVRFLEKDEIKRKEIELGIEGDIEIEVLEGLEENEEILVNGF